MTGDGVNDVLALKDADCGIAMASGAQAASQVAQLVLLDSDFAAPPSVVGEGRRVINNIQRSASLSLVKNIFSFLLSIVALALPLAYPFQPLQLSLVTFATIGAPAFFLALGQTTSWCAEIHAQRPTGRAARRADRLPCSCSAPRGLAMRLISPQTWWAIDLHLRGFCA